MTPRQVLCINTGGAGTLDEIRSRQLAAFLPDAEPTFYGVDKSARRKAMGEITRIIASKPWDLVYQEGTGIAAGLPVIAAARRRGQRYIISVGDPVRSFFRVTRGPFYAAPFGVYERQLYRSSVGVVGWTPYLVGRALTMGAPRAATIEGGVDSQVFHPFTPDQRQSARDRFGLPRDHLICGVVGSLTWVERQKYCYGLDLIETLKRVARTDVSLLIVGDGDGKARLEALVPPGLRDRVRFTGRLPATDVVAAMNAMDVGFITQTLDDLGSYRLTTKMPEYLACGLPVAMSPVPGYFDYVGTSAGWALPAFHPAREAFHAACAAWLQTLDRDEVREKAQQTRPIALARFSYDQIGRRFREFVQQLMP